MGVISKLLTQISIKWKRDLFNVFRFPTNLVKIAPKIIQNVTLHVGHWGAVGSVAYWNYTIEGKKNVAKEIVEVLDEKKKLLMYNIIEGDLLKSYNLFKITVDVDTKEKDNLVTYTLEYKKKSKIGPDPLEIRDCYLQLYKERECNGDEVVPN